MYLAFHFLNIICFKQFCDLKLAARVDEPKSGDGDLF